MKVFYIYGTNDSNAGVEFHNEYYNSHKALIYYWHQANERLNNRYEFKERCFIKALEFDGIVDQNFVRFIKEKICDYDNLKQTDFYIVEE